MGRYKNIDRKVNQVARKINKQIEEDNIWRGRFVLRQLKKRLEIYPDGSRMSYYKYRLYDKKTGEYADSCWFSEFQILNSYCLWDFANNAIVETFKVWEYDEYNPNHPFRDQTNYLKVPLAKKKKL